MEGGRSYSVFFILRAPHRLQLSRAVVIPRREKKRPSPRGRACVPHRARGARHGTREATHAHTSKRVSRSRPSHFSRRPSQYNPPTSARVSGRDHLGADARPPRRSRDVSLARSKMYGFEGVV